MACWALDPVARGTNREWYDSGRRAAGRGYAGGVPLRGHGVADRPATLHRGHEMAPHPGGGRRGVRDRQPPGGLPRPGRRLRRHAARGGLAAVRAARAGLVLDGRALAESTKTLAWRYAVGGAPFPADLPLGEAQIRFLARLRELLRDAPATSLTPMGSAAVTDAMNDLRGRDFAARKQAYIRHRVEDQLQWYTAKAQGNVVRARRWRLLLIAVEGLGLTAAVLRLTDVLHFDLAGVARGHSGCRLGVVRGPAVRDAGPRLHLRRHRAERRPRPAEPDHDASWAQEVSDAEEAISREHTMWRASRGAG